MIDTVNPLPRPKNLQGYFTRFSAFLQGNPDAQKTGIKVGETAVYGVLKRNGLNTRHDRLKMD